MSNSSRIAKNTMFLYFRSLFVLIISLYTSRVILRTLGVTDYGIYNVVGGVISMLGFLKSNMQATYQRYYNVEMGRGNIDGVRKMFQASLTIQVIIAIVVLLIAETVGLWFVCYKLVIPDSRMDATLWIYQVAIVSFLLTVFSSPFSAAITAYERMGVFAVISIIDAVLRLAIVFALEWLPGDHLIVYAILLLGIAILNLLMHVGYGLKRIPTISLHIHADGPTLRSMFSFSGWSLMGLLAQTLKSQGINIVLNLFFGPVVNAARGISYQILSAVNQFIHSFQTSFRPQLTKSYASGDYDYMMRLYYSSTKLSYFLIFTLSLPILLETPMILHLWLGDNIPEHTVAFTRIILLTAFVSAFANPTSCIAFATGRIKWFSIIVSGLNLLIVPAAYFFLWLGYEPEAAFIVSFAITILVQLVRIIVVSRMTVLSLRDYIASIIFPLAMYTIASVIPPYAIIMIMDAEWYRLLVIIAVSVLSSLSFMWIVAMNRVEKELCKNFIQSKLKKRQNK